MTKENIKEALLSGYTLSNDGWLDHEYIYFDTDKFCIVDEEQFRVNLEKLFEHKEPVGQFYIKEFTC